MGEEDKKKKKINNADYFIFNEALFKKLKLKKKEEIFNLNTQYSFF